MLQWTIDNTIPDNTKGPSRPFSGRGFHHIFRRDMGKVDFEIAGNRMSYAHDTVNVLIFLFSIGKDERYEKIA